MSAGRHGLRHALLAFVVVGTGLLVWVLLRNQPTPVTVVTESAPAPGIEVRVAAFSYSETRDGRTVWQLDAESAERDLTQGQTRIQRPKVTFFDAQGGVQARLEGASGWLVEARREAVVEGDVVVVLADGTRCLARQLRLDAEANRVMTDTGVRFEAPRWVLTGDAMAYDLQTGRMVLSGTVRARLSLGEDNR